MKKYLLTIILLWIINIVYPQSNDQNYIRVRTFTYNNENNGGSNNEYLDVIQYFDVTTHPHFFLSFTKNSNFVNF